MIKRESRQIVLSEEFIGFVEHRGDDLIESVAPCHLDIELHLVSPSELDGDPSLLVDAVRGRTLEATGRWSGALLSHPRLLRGYRCRRHRYYANYLKFAERARTEYLRLLGVDQTKLKESDGVFFAVRRAEVEYLKPARLDDELEVRTKLTALGASVIDALQLICRGQEVLAQVVMRVVCIGASDGKPARIPRRLREAWLPYIAAA